MAPATGNPMGMNRQLPLLEASWAAPADAAAARVGLERWRERARELEPALGDRMRSLADDTAGTAMLAMLFGGSPFLSSTALREPALILDLVDRGPDAVFGTILADLERETASEDDRTRLMAALRRAKRRTALSVALADIASAWDLPRVTDALTTLADRSVDAALAHLLRRDVARGRLRATAARPEGSGLVILGMGKLGARELNYSSDIDLIILYDPECGVVDPAEAGTVWVRITRDLVALLEERTADGYVFRVDLRLRPDAGATPPAIAIPAAEAYYTSVAQNWERSAMIKARPIAGDRAAGEAFLSFLSPFIWRRSLDFAAIRDIRAIKRQIHDYRGHDTVAGGTSVEGRDIKLSRGGIREIEFFVQTHQLIWGGRDPTLRVRGTVAGLEALVAAGLVEAATAERLADAYAVLRRIEHRLQMIDDRQTHALPADPEGVERFARFMGLADGAALSRLVRETTATVERCTAPLLTEEAETAEEARRLSFAGVDEPPETIAALEAMGYRRPADIVAIVRGWLAGRHRALHSERARSLLDQMLTPLLEAFGRGTDPDGAIARFDRLLAGLPAGVQLFSLFRANPGLFDLVAEILSVGGRFASHLAASPRQLDAVLGGDFFAPLPGRDVLAETLRPRLAATTDYEDALDLLRRWTNDQRFRAGVHLLRALDDADTCSRFLSEVADLGLASALDAAEAAFAARHGGFGERRFLILGMGRLAGRELSVRSDLDLVMIYDDLPPDLVSDGPKPLPAPTYFVRLTQRVVAAVTARTAEGALYEVDMRLRPSGNAGPVAISLDAFGRYQATQAWTWEHMALTRARVVAGPAALAARVEDTIRRVLTTPRDADALRADVVAMRRRIADQHPGDGPWDLKYVRGGLVDIEFLAQYLQLREAARVPSVLNPNTRAALAGLSEAGVLAAADHTALAEAHRLFQAVQSFLRLTTDGPGDLDGASPALLRALGRILAVATGEAALAEAEDPRPRAAAILAERQAGVLAVWHRLLEPGPLAGAPGTG